MPTHIALLRGINVTGHRKVPMADLRALLQSRGMDDVRTYLQSGNVVLSSTLKGGALEAELKRAIADHWGYDVPVFVRSAAELRRVLKNTPYGREKNIKALYVTFLAKRPPKALVEGLQTPAGTDDDFTIDGATVYLRCPGGYGRTKISNNWFEAKLKTIATTRNWRTIGALVELAGTRA